MLANFVPLADFFLASDIASKQAADIDALWWFETAVTVVMTVLIFVGVGFFAFKYRKRPGVQATQIEGSTFLEVSWSVIPFLVMLVMFWWGADLFYAAVTPPKDAMEVFVTGKQWMWKVQYPNGYREIDALHVPVGQPVKLTLASEDVIHSFSIPAFRVRHDVVPGTYDTLWFTPSKPGVYHLFCTEYCGNQHAHMIGYVTVLEQPDWEKWSAGGGSTGTLAEQGEKLFTQNGCSTCHLLDQQGRCPILRGLYNKPVQLADGRTVLADDAYIRESILQPNAKIVAGFEPNVMPNFQGQLSEEQVIQLIAYVKSLGSTTAPPAPGSPTAPGAPTAPVKAAPKLKTIAMR
jgi:cytochrome c oxidase subunit 2